MRENEGVVTSRGLRSERQTALSLRSRLTGVSPEVNLCPSLVTRVRVTSDDERISLHCCLCLNE